MQEIERVLSPEERFDSYKRFLLLNRGIEQLIELPAIKDIIYNIIENGDSKCIEEGHSPIGYRAPKEDGTFDIYGRMDGIDYSVVYIMDYCLDDNNDHFIVLTKKDKRLVEDRDSDEVIYINKEGYISDSFVSEKPKQYKKNI